MNRTEQEQFWVGDFGDEYVERCKDPKQLASRAAALTKMLARTAKVKSVLEFGANVGMNLIMLRILLPDAKLSAIEINAKAAEYLRQLGYVDVHHRSVYEFELKEKFDLSLVSGVLIHQAPERLPEFYEKLHAASSRYILISEYYNPTPVEVNYRGHPGKLFKRDFAGEIIDKYNLKLVDYGFQYHRDPNFPADDVNWFLLEK